MMRRLQRFLRARFQRKYWICTAIASGVHIYPNRDTFRHQVVDCPCGPYPIEARNENGDLVPMVKHWSLDARERLER